MLSLITKGILAVQRVISNQVANQYYELPLVMEIEYFNNPMLIDTPNLILTVERRELELFLEKEE
jgi:hypothetical protein